MDSRPYRNVGNIALNCFNIGEIVTKCRKNRIWAVNEKQKWVSAFTFTEMCDVMLGLSRWVIRLIGLAPSHVEQVSLFGPNECKEM